MAKRTVLIEFDFNWVRDASKGDVDKEDDVYHRCLLPLACLTVFECNGVSGRCKWWGLLHPVRICDSVEQAKREAELCYLSYFAVKPFQDITEPELKEFMDKLAREKRMGKVDQMWRDDEIEPTPEAAWFNREFEILFEKAKARGMMVLAITIRDIPDATADRKTIDFNTPLNSESTAELFEMLAAGIREKIG